MRPEQPYVVSIGWRNLSLSVRNDDLFKTNDCWLFNFEKRADCLAILLAQSAHVRFFYRRGMVVKVKGIRNQTSRPGRVENQDLTLCSSYFQGLC